MKRYAALFLVLIILMFTLPSQAQDTDATDEPAATVEVVATVTASDFVTPTESATETPFVVTATATPAPPPVVIPPVTPDPMTTTSLALIERLGYWLVIIAMAFIIYTSNKSLREMVSVDTVKALYKDAQGVVGRVTEAIPGKIDDAVAEAILNRVKEYMDNYYAPPVEGGAVTVNVNPDKPAGA